MINSLFIINKDREILLEKHWKSIASRSCLDCIREGETKLSDVKDIPPVIECSNGSFLINVYQGGIFLVAVCAEEVPPLLVIEFLNQVIFILEDYYGTLSELTILENLVGIFELLDEMLDNGFPLATESNILKELIRPPKLLRSITDAVTGRSTGVTSTLPLNQLTNIRWRRSGVKYTNNEAFFDITEKVNALIDKSGTVLLAEIEGAVADQLKEFQIFSDEDTIIISGSIVITVLSVGLDFDPNLSCCYTSNKIDCLVHLSGTPDLTLSFNNPRLLEDVSLHPCVRYCRWEKQRILSFVPPDGRFRLFTYYIPNLAPVSIPVSLRNSVTIKEVGSRLELSVVPKTTAGKPLEHVKLSMVLPSEVSNVNLTASAGKSTFDPVSKLLVWNVGRVEPRSYPSLKGSITLLSGVTQVSTMPVINLEFQLPQNTVSGLRVCRLDLHTENYKPFKGVKYLTTSGSFEFRV